MPATEHRAIMDLTVRLLVGALLLGALVATGVGLPWSGGPATLTVNLAP